MGAVISPARLKLVGAGLVLVSLALPVASCSHFEDAHGRRVRVQGEAPAGVRSVVDYSYPLEGFDAADPSDWLVVLAYTWPALALACLRRWPRGGRALTVRLLELPLVAGSLALVDLLATLFVERRAVGFYVAAAGLLAYAAGALWADGRLLRERRRAAAVVPPPLQAP